MSKKEKDTANMKAWEEWIGSCVLLHRNGKCAVLEKYRCSPKDMTCPFHKTADEMAASYAAWKKRMNELPEDTQEYIARTYHNGVMLWKQADART